MTKEEQKIDILICGIKDNYYDVAKDLLIEHDKQIRAEILKEIEEQIIWSEKENRWIIPYSVIIAEQLKEQNND